MWKSLLNLLTNYVDQKSKVWQATAKEHEEKAKLASKLVEKQAFKNSLFDQKSKVWQATVKEHEEKVKVWQATAKEHEEKAKLAAKLVEKQAFENSLASKLVEKQAFENLSKRLLLGSAAIALLYLAIDYVVHDNEYYLKYKIRKKMTQIGNSRSISPIFKRTLPSYDQNVPTVVVGETGVGKTTLLEQVLEDRKSKRLPTLLLSLRVGGQKEVSGAPNMVIYYIELVFFFYIFNLILILFSNRQT